MPTVGINTVTPFEGNAKKGDLPKIKASLAKLGQYKPIVVNVGSLTGRPYEILAGNNTHAAALELGWTEIETHEVDVSQEEAVQINLLDNKLSELGEYDKEALAKQLKDLTNFEITGYDAADLDLLYRETAQHADAFVAQMNVGMAAPAAAPQFSAPQAAPAPQGAPAAAPAANPFSTDENVSRETSAPAAAPAAAPAEAPAPHQPVDDTVYFTMSFTVTAEQREAIQAAIRKIQGENAEQRPTSPQAITEICQRFVA